MSIRDNLAPIIIFAFNRPYQFKRSIESLLSNSEAKKSDLFVFIDGARDKKDKEAIDLTNEIVSSIIGFKSVTINNSAENKGLARSIIDGVTQIIELYGRAIILEDDLTYSKNFLSYMNQALSLYENESQVFSVCGYSNSINCPKDYIYDLYLCTRSSSWGWATWSDRWRSVDWELEEWSEVKKRKASFNNWGGTDCFAMLKAWKDRKNDSWAIRFCYSQFIQNKISLFPLKSKVKNVGFDGSGTNCKKYNRFRCDFDVSDNKSFKFPNKIEVIDYFKKSALHYHSISMRLWSRLNYLFNR